MAIKTYALLSSMDTNAHIYQTTAEGKRVQFTKKPYWRPFLRITYQDKNGISRTIRYKSTATDGEGKSVLDQREQIDKLKIEANEPFTSTERRDLEFRNGILMTNKKIAQDFLESYPGIEGFDGTCDEIREPIFKVLDNVADAKGRNDEVKKRLRAGSKLMDLDLDGAKTMLVRLNGSFFTTPDDIEECQDLLIQFLDDAGEEGLDSILKEDKEITVDEKTTVLIGSLLNEGKLSFEKTAGKISKLGKDGKWIVIRDMADTYTLDERKRLFSDFLNTEEGKALRIDLEKDLAKVKK